MGSSPIQGSWLKGHSYCNCRAIPSDTWSTWPDSKKESTYLQMNWEKKALFSR